MIVSEGVINSTDLYNCSDLGQRPKLSLTDLSCSSLGIFMRIQTIKLSKEKNTDEDIFSSQILNF